MFKTGLLKLSLLFCLLVINGCGSYAQKVAPVPLPAQNKHVNVSGALLLGQAYTDPDHAEAAFGFDIRGAGLLPVRVVVDNQTGSEVHLLGEQTFLIDEHGQAWPLLTASQANERVQSYVEIAETFKGSVVPTILMGAAGAAAGLAIGVLSGADIGDAAAKGAVLGGTVGAIYGAGIQNEEIEHEVRHDLARHSLSNQSIASGALAYGYLFFPGQDEAQSAHSLRLSIMINDQQRTVNLMLPPEQ